MHASHHSTCSLETRRRRRRSHQGQQITMAATYVNVYAHTSYPAAKAQKHSLPSFLQSEYLSLSTYTKWGGEVTSSLFKSNRVLCGAREVFFKKKSRKRGGGGLGSIHKRRRRRRPRLLMMASRSASVVSCSNAFPPPFIGRPPPPLPISGQERDPSVKYLKAPPPRQSELRKKYLSLFPPPFQNCVPFCFWSAWLLSAPEVFSRWKEKNSNS